ncbi:MAG: hypothetical protein ISS93_03620 [Candidatus Aenigmarchaeota archaeon]|nr:hypothetical protein [Candidatus Aenigmarchaeota archaeon]
MPETIQRVAVPRIQIYGAGDLNRLAPFIFEGEVGTEIERLGEPFKDIHAYSGALRDLRGLYEIGLAHEMGQELDLPAEALEAGKTVYHVFHQRPKGNVTDDACDYNGGKQLRKVLDTDRSVRWIVHPAGFEDTEDGWKANLGEHSDVRYILVPKTGFTEMTVDGAYRPDTGTPFATNESRKKAVQTWVKAGIPEEIAGKEVSYFYSREEGQGTAAGGRWRNNPEDGPFYVYAVYEPGLWSSNIGSFPVSRSAERSEAGPEDRGVQVVSVDEYRRLVADSKTLETVRKTVQK